jgi:hypothetical protein
MRYPTTAVPPSRAAGDGAAKTPTGEVGYPRPPVCPEWHPTAVGWPCAVASRAGRHRHPSAPDGTSGRGTGRLGRSACDPTSRVSARYQKAVLDIGSSFLPGRADGKLANKSMCWAKSLPGPGRRPRGAPRSSPRTGPREVFTRERLPPVRRPLRSRPGPRSCAAPRPAPAVRPARRRRMGADPHRCRSPRSGRGPDG